MPQYIYINGFPGTGKLTIANALAALVPGARVVHNHLLIDPVEAMVGRASPHYYALRASLRRHVLVDMIASGEATAAATWIFTDACSPGPGAGGDGPCSARDYEEAARKRGVPFVPVVLSCGLEENVRRIVSEGRGGRANTKLVDPEVLRKAIEEEVLFRFGGPSELELDVTDLAPAEAAQMILEHASKFAEQPRAIKAGE